MSVKTCAVCGLLLLIAEVLAQTLPPETTISTAVPEPQCNRINECNNRGNATLYLNLTCVCTCDRPYYGPSCLETYTLSQLPCNDPWVTANCLLAAPKCTFNNISGVCTPTTPANYSNLPNATAEPTSWCEFSYPLPFVAVLFMMAAFGFGVGGIGVTYMGRVWNTPSKVTPWGERVANALYRRTAPYALYSFALFGVSGLEGVSVVLFFFDFNYCYYPYLVYPFLGVFCVPIVVLVLYGFVVFLRWLIECRDRSFHIDDYVLPRTEDAMLNPFYCQTRSF